MNYLKYAIDMSLISYVWYIRSIIENMVVISKNKTNKYDEGIKQDCISLIKLFFISQLYISLKYILGLRNRIDIAKD